MCSDPRSGPPIEPTASGMATGAPLRLQAADGNRFGAFAADAAEPSGSGIIILPDYHGLGPFYEELALRFAETGTDALVIDFYGRTAAPPPRDASFDHVDHANRTTWRGLLEDVRAAARDIRSRRQVTSLSSIGFCFGGRVSFLLGTVPELALAGVIGFYGWPLGPYRNDMPAPADMAGALGSPLLGIFGGADDKISAADVAAFEEALAVAGADCRIVVYEGAPHSFFDRAAPEHAAAAMAAWAVVGSFLQRVR